MRAWVGEALRSKIRRLGEALGFLRPVPANFCILPFVSAQARANSVVSACCLNSETARDERGRELYLYKTSFAEAVQSTYFKKLRAAFLNNERPSSCNRCFHDESLGIKSRRLNENENHEHWIQPVLKNRPPKQPVVFDLNLGTTCNLKCRICGPLSSSRWVKEYIDLFGDDYIPRDDEALRAMPTEESRGLLLNWPEKSPDLFPTLRQWMKRAERLEFFGGEPMLSPRHVELVRHSVEIGASRKQTLRYATNGTVYHEELAERLWPKFRAVHLNISVDGAGRQFEYQRHGGSWDTLCATVDRYQALEHPLIAINVSISNFNVFYIPEIFHYWQERGVLTNDNNFVQNPNRFDIRGLPPALKLAVRRKYERWLPRMEALGRRELEAILRMMECEQIPHVWMRFLESVHFHDEYRGQSYPRVFPEFYELARDAGVWMDYRKDWARFQQAFREEAAAAGALSG